MVQPNIFQFWQYAGDGKKAASPKKRHAVNTAARFIMFSLQIYLPLRKIVPPNTLIRTIGRTMYFGASRRMKRSGGKDYEP